MNQGNGGTAAASSFSIKDAAATSPGDLACSVCLRTFGTDVAGASKCCAGEKSRRQRRLDHLVGVYNRKAAELGRIEEEIEKLGGSLE